MDINNYIDLDVYCFCGCCFYVVMHACLMQICKQWTIMLDITYNHLCWEDTFSQSHKGC